MALEKTLNAIKHITGADVFQEALRKEAELRKQAGETPENRLLPTECGFKIGAKIFGLRLKTMLTYPAYLFARWSGADLLYKGLLGKKLLKYTKN